MNDEQRNRYNNMLAAFRPAILRKGDAHDQLANGIQTFKGLLCHNSDIGYYLVNGSTSRAISDNEAWRAEEEYANATDKQRAAYEAANRRQT